MPERSPRGTYLRIADVIETEISRNSAVTSLPSEGQLMETHRVGRTTVRRALESLAAKGLITSRP
ncbi:GntR family transcriptional regulator [Kitasatospora sp. NPDC015120]|uniref:GntR family transcriptional regulator n=1 Tax=Kitasatospora sp. NPDC015120 TaxID=3364023 RepID=UPI0036F48580